MHLCVYVCARASVVRVGGQMHAVHVCALHVCGVNFTPFTFHSKCVYSKSGVNFTPFSME